MFKYIILRTKIIQQRILHHEELEDLKAVNNLNVVNEFNKFMNVFFSEKNATNREILNSLTSTENELKNLIKVNNDKIKMKYNKIKNNAKMIKNEYKKKEKKKKEKKKKEKKKEEKKEEKKKKKKKKKDEENHKIIKISD